MNSKSSMTILEDVLSTLNKSGSVSLEAFLFSVKVFCQKKYFDYQAFQANKIIFLVNWGKEFRTRFLKASSFLYSLK